MTVCRKINPGQVPSGDPACQHGTYCNSCLAYVHDGWFGAVYPDGNTINLTGNEYFYMGRRTSQSQQLTGLSFGKIKTLKPTSSRRRSCSISDSVLALIFG